MKRFEKWLPLFCLLWCGGVAHAALPTTWNVRASGVSIGLNAVTYGNGLFVAVGSQTTILTSPDGMNWTPRASGAAPTLWSAAYGNGRYVIGGGESALILTATNGVQWSNTLSTTGTENILGLTFAYGQFVGVGRGGPYGTGYIITSSNGVDWVSRPVPTTNILFAVSAAVSADGVGWADPVYVAVGDHGTILSSTNGADWVLRNSGTAFPLRSAAWHGQMLVGGDSGTILTSPDAIAWSTAAPTSFINRGLVSRFSDPAVVAVGNQFNSGALQASIDGTAWPGFNLTFAQPFNGVAYGQNSFVAVGDGGLIVQSLTGPLALTNEWTKATSGYWEEAYWSTGLLPSLDFQAIALRNSGWKALAIGENTTANYPASLTINNLIVDAPTDSANQLLLNWAGLAVPLTIRSNLTVGTNGSLASHYSVLQAAVLDLSGQATFSDSATADVGCLSIRSGGVLALNDAALTVSTLSFFSGSVTQTAGANVVMSLALPVPSYDGPGGSGTAGTYLLSSGLLHSSNAVIGWPGLNFQGLGHFQQSGGTHSNATMTLWGYTRTQSAHPVGFYNLNGGVLVSDDVNDSGEFVQKGGTNQIQSLGLHEGGKFSLYNGILVTTDVALTNNLGVDEYLLQTGGVHTVKNRLLLSDGGSYPLYYLMRYSLSAGILNASNIDIRGAALNWSGGSVSNSGLFTLGFGGGLLAGPVTNGQLGKLQVTDAVSYPVIVDVNPFGFPTNGTTVLRFQDSHDVPWSGSLRIWRWSGSALPSGLGPDHIFIGTNSQSLTADQLSKIRFYGPLGWPLGPDGLPTNYPAALLASGELVPGVPPALGFTKTANALVLSWPGSYELVSATNVLGPYNLMPGATSPWTNQFIDAQRYFRLRLPAP